MSWADKVKATALATAAEHTATPARFVADASYRWNAYDVWLSRVQPPRELAAQPPKSAPTTQPRQGTALHSALRD